MPMYNLLYYSKYFRKTTGSLWIYYPDIPKSGHNDYDNLRERIIYPNKDSESFDYKTKLIGNVPDVADAADNDVKTEFEEIKIVVPLKNISNSVFNLEFLLINSESELILKWTEDCILTEKATGEFRAGEDGPPALDEVPAINRPKDLKFSVIDCKLYVPVVTL